ncbi:GIY-YIG nuclease family protein [Candidatus Dojkabacteria bacterium]|jgi:putative endonuclease|nr:GIY-YIG nuclease family protein [Candidatus Dojkabacteria bacterium]
MINNVKKWFVYIVESNDKEILYCGITNNIDKRINTHNKGKGSKALRGKRLPVTCVYKKEFENRSEASKEEYRIKQLTKIEKLKLIK